ncbi:radical SAM protein [Halodesulfurarchaeum formicicum]|nr:radical SAM protein [Halodesulfurarchaeum formicicum]
MDPLRVQCLMELAYGPVPSRRLGQSLGINNVPPTTCTYACVYCQLGSTTNPETDRQAFFDPAEIESAIEDRLAALGPEETVDYVTFVPDGEPTLDANLGETIDRLQRFPVDVAVITNGSLLRLESVRADLARADWLSVKVDAADHEVWTQVDRPHGAVDFEAVRDGIVRFARDFEGTLTTETMLVAGVNDGAAVEPTAELVGEIAPDTAFVAVPPPPPDEEWVEPPDEAEVTRAYRTFSEYVDDVEYLIGAEGDTFASTGDPRTDLLGVTAVHPMRASQVSALLDREDADWSVVEDLLDAGELIELEYDAETFYVRPISPDRH